MAEEGKLTMKSKPTLPRLMLFPNDADVVDVIARIGPKYQEFGTFLLNDEDGSIVDSIEMKFREEPYRINREILKRWLQGHGKGPVTYATLVRVLKRIELGVLAQTIETALR